MKSYNWLTERDNAVYDYLKYHAKYASTSQLTELFFGQNDKGQIKNAKLICRRRMAALEKNIPEITSFYRQANSDKVYTVLPPKEYLTAVSKIEHSMELNEIYIKVKDYAQKRGHTIHDFRIEQALQLDITPDIILIYVIDNRARIFLIEYDKGTETLTQIRKKVDKYAQYMARQLYLSENWQPGAIKPEVCFITFAARVPKIQKLGVTACKNVLDLIDF